MLSTFICSRICVVECFIVILPQFYMLMILFAEKVCYTPTVMSFLCEHFITREQIVKQKVPQ